ncbi:hypothetical protein AVEN_63051-1 [Araneus ventricosus]|uniref:Uncharacterized protein n=1 Tax=Araneus ventricosus TaxID=182803 RepID=A0A4Y2JH97_ARAVE|nr:hypothetical protein AVEN_63051-1 [Araneus ventricosus]
MTSRNVEKHANQTFAQKGSSTEWNIDRKLHHLKRIREITSPKISEIWLDSLRMSLARWFIHTANHFALSVNVFPFLFMKGVSYVGKHGLFLDATCYSNDSHQSSVPCGLFANEK